MLKVKKFLGSHGKVLAFFSVMGLVGGYLVGLYSMDSYPAEVQQQIIAQGIDRTTLGVISAVQSLGYGLVLGALVFGLLKSWDCGKKN